MELIERASRAGNDTLMVTVATPVTRTRLRDVRNGMTIPPAITLKTLLDASYRPGWWFNFLTHEPPSTWEPRRARRSPFNRDWSFHPVFLLQGRPLCHGRPSEASCGGHWNSSCRNTRPGASVFSTNRRAIRTPVPGHWGSREVLFPARPTSPGVTVISSAPPRRRVPRPDFAGVPVPLG
jgi:FMN-dependent dehydrogenase